MSVTPKVARQTFDAQPAKLAHAQTICPGLDKGAHLRKQHAVSKCGESPDGGQEDRHQDKDDPASASRNAWRGLLFCRGQKL
jgi:hypothetical protein